MASGLALACLLSLTLAEKEIDLRTPGEAASIYETGPFAGFARDYFARFHRDAVATPTDHETVIDDTWRIVVPQDAAPLAEIMAHDLAEFLTEVMHQTLPVERQEVANQTRCILLTHAERTGKSFRISVTPECVEVEGDSPAALRDGVVKLVDWFGFRQAPYLEHGRAEYAPRVGLRVGVVPFGGDYREAVFMGYNGVILSPTRDTRNGSPVQFMELSSSEAIPEWKEYQKPELMEAMARESEAARRYGLKCYAMLQMWKAFPRDDPLFETYPDMRGAQVHFHMNEDPWGFLPCTEHPLVRQYLGETMTGIARRLHLDGAAIIIGGEVFQHCFMRPANVEIGHTNCPRCEASGAPVVVSNLCNLLGAAIQEANPDGRLFAWPYSATFFWSSDRYQSRFIGLLEPSVALLTEIEKEEVIQKTERIQKSIWDYSIDLIGPGERARRQIALARENDVEVYLKSEPELAFEAPGLPQIPCQDRWWDRADALASAGVDGAWVFPFFVPFLGSTSGEIYKYAWWAPHPSREDLLAALAGRIAGEPAAPPLREAWRQTSRAIEFSPDMPPYFSGPYYLGPVHPMFADPEAELSEPYASKSPFGALFMREARGDIEAFGAYYGEMRDTLRKAVDSLEKAEPLVTETYRNTFEAEAIPIRWFYHTARTHANFYASCLLRRQLLEEGAPVPEASVRTLLARWRSVLLDEQENALAAAPLLEKDPRLALYRPNTGLPSGQELMKAKLASLDDEIQRFLPALEKRLLENDRDANGKQDAP